MQASLTCKRAGIEIVDRKHIGRKTPRNASFWEEKRPRPPDEILYKKGTTGEEAGVENLGEVRKGRAHRPVYEPQKKAQPRRSLCRIMVHKKSLRGWARNSKTTGIAERELLPGPRGGGGIEHPATDL